MTPKQEVQEQKTVKKPFFYQEVAGNTSNRFSSTQSRRFTNVDKNVEIILILSALSMTLSYMETDLVWDSSLGLVVSHITEAYLNASRSVNNLFSPLKSPHLPFY